MKLFSEANAYADTLREYFIGQKYSGSGNGRLSIFYFESEMPSNLNDLPFDIRDPIEILKNSVGHSEIDMNYLDRYFSFDKIYEGTPSGAVPTTTLACISYQDSNRDNLWRIFPKYVVAQSSLNTIKDPSVNKIIQWAQSERYLDLTPNIFWNDPDDYLETNDSRQYRISYTRNQYNDPIVVDFEEEISISRIDLQQTQSGYRYDIDYFDIEFLSSETGEWESFQRCNLLSRNSKDVLILDNVLKAKTIRLRPGDTGLYQWIVKYLSFFGPEKQPSSPTSDSRTVKWAAILPYWYAAVGYGSNYDRNYDRNLTQTIKTRNKNGFPIMGVSVGNSSSPGVINLESTVLGPRDKIIPTSLNFFI